MTLAPAIAAFLVHANQVLDATLTKHHAILGGATRVEIDTGGKAYARLVRVTTSRTGEVVSRSAAGFVALVDSDTRTLGHVTAGDLLKTDGWKKPARGVRGSVLRPETWGRFSAYGGIA